MTRHNRGARSETSPLMNPPGQKAQHYLLCHGPGEDVVCPTLLVCSDEFWDIDGRSGFHAAHVWSQLLL